MNAAVETKSTKKPPKSENHQPLGGRIKDLRRLVLEKISDDDIGQIVDKLIELAKGGNFAAIKLVLSYTVGKPDTTARQVAKFFDEPTPTPTVPAADLPIGTLESTLIAAADRGPEQSAPSANGIFRNAADTEIAGADTVQTAPKSQAEAKSGPPEQRR